MLNKLIDQLPIIPCQEATRLGSESMDRKLSLKEKFDLWLHLRVCDLCSHFVKQVYGLRTILRNYQPQDEKKMPQQVKDHIKKAIHDSPSA